MIGKIGAVKMLSAEKFWDKAAQSYAKKPIDDEASYAHTLGRTRHYLSPDDHVLELGCGTGSTALLLAGDVAHLTASDLSANMIDIGRTKAAGQGVTNITFITADLFDKALENGPYDCVLALNLLHLVGDVPAVITRINALLKPGGLFISKTTCRPDKAISPALLLIKSVLPLMQLLGKAPLVNFMAIEALETLITSQGFDIIEAGNKPASLPNRYIVARKK